MAFDGTVDMARRGALMAAKVVAEAAGANKRLSGREIEDYVAAHASPWDPMGAEEVERLLDQLYETARKLSRSKYAPSQSSLNAALAKGVAEIAGADANRDGKLSAAEQKTLRPLAASLLYFSHQFRDLAAGGESELSKEALLELMRDEITSRHHTRELTPSEAPAAIARAAKAFFSDLDPVGDWGREILEVTHVGSVVGYMLVVPFEDGFGHAIGLRPDGTEVGRVRMEA